MSAAEDLYATLGVSRDAAPGDIRKAYRQAAKRVHPDAGGSREAFEEVNRAHLVLADPARRARYDRDGHADDKVDNVEATALQILSGLLREILMSELDTTRCDVAQMLRDALQRQIAQLEQTVYATKVTVKKSEAMSKRFRGGKGRPVIERLLEEQRRGMAAAIADGEGKIEARRRALAILADVRFDVDRKSPFVNFGTF